MLHPIRSVHPAIHRLPNGVGSTAQSFAYPGGTERIVKMWYHHDRLGSTAYLTDNVVGSVESFVSYDDWGAPTMKAIVRLGSRDLDLVTNYTGHPYDPVLGVYYARARMYDAVDRRFMAVDPINGWITEPQTLAQYTYVLNRPLVYSDALGLNPEAVPALIVKRSNSYVTDIILGSDTARIYVSLDEVIDAWGSIRKYKSKSISDDVYTRYVIQSGEPTPLYEAIILYNTVAKNVVTVQVMDKSTGHAVSLPSRTPADFVIEGDCLYVDIQYFMMLMCKIGEEREVTYNDMLIRAIREELGIGTPSTDAPLAQTIHELKTNPRKLTWSRSNEYTYRNESDVSVIARMLFGEDFNAIEGHLWVLENRRQYYAGGRTYRQLVLAPGQFTAMDKGKALNPASQFGSSTGRPKWEDCVDGAANLVYIGISAIQRPNQDEPDFTYKNTHSYTKTFADSHQPGYWQGGTWFYNMSNWWR